MIIRLQKTIGVVFLCCFFSIVCWSQDAFDLGRLIIYPGTARSDLLEIINKAEKTIDMAAYQIKDPQIAGALQQKAQGGIAVRMIIEDNPFEHAFNKDSQQDYLLPALKEAGVEVKGRPDALQAEHPGGHYHARYLIIDGKKLIVTTGNFDETTFDHCRDFAIVIDKKGNVDKFMSIQKIFENDWKSLPVSIPSDQAAIILGPDGQREKIQDFLRSAKKSIKIYQQYCNDPESAATLIDIKKNRGVDIQLLMMAYPSSYDKDVNQDTQDQLQKGGIQVKLVDVDDQIYMHARSIIVDDEYALIGTANLSPPSLSENRELSLIIKGQALEDIKSQFAQDWAKSLDLQAGRKKAGEKKIDWNTVSRENNQHDRS